MVDAIELLEQGAGAGLIGDVEGDGADVCA